MTEPAVLRDPYTAKPTVLFDTTKRVDGGVQDFDAIKLMKFSASSHDCGDPHPLQGGRGCGSPFRQPWISSGFDIQQ